MDLIALKNKILEAAFHTLCWYLVVCYVEMQWNPFSYSQLGRFLISLGAVYFLGTLYNLLFLEQKPLVKK